MSRYTWPAPLDESFRVDQLSSGTDALDGWLCHRAQTNQASGASRTFVSCSTNDRKGVVGFYSLAASSVALEWASRNR